MKEIIKEIEKQIIDACNEVNKDGKFNFELVEGSIKIIHTPIKCERCKKYFDETDMHSKKICDDCFDLMMDEEDDDFNIYYSQNEKCFLCQEKLSSWTIQTIEGNKRAVCLNSCKKISR